MGIEIDEPCSRVGCEFKAGLCGACPPSLEAQEISGGWIDRPALGFTGFGDSSEVGPAQMERVNEPGGTMRGETLMTHIKAERERRRIAGVAPISQVIIDPFHQAPASQRQVGGDHYKKTKIQPFDYSMANGLDAMQHTIIKYVTRFRDKAGIQDLEKARHVIDMLIEFEMAKPSLRA